MLHVTTMDSLELLKAQRTDRAREYCRRMAEFRRQERLLNAWIRENDKALVEIARKIRALEPPPDKTPPPLKRTKPVILDGLTEQEQEHYRQLVKGKTK